LGKDKSRRWKAVRVDYVAVSEEEWWYGVLGWTGSAQYMRMLKIRAASKKLSLNNHRLWDTAQVR
jgi:DNA polymerase/3'-5' exonuclease PolX